MQALTGDKDLTLGTWLHSIFNPGYENWNPNAPPDAPARTGGGGGW